MNIGMQSIVAVALLAATGACRQSGEDRARDVRQRADIEARASQSEVVQELRSPTDAGRLIYEAQPDLSYATLLRTRPDLASRRDTAR